MRKIGRLLALSSVLATGNALAECHWEWLCNGTGGCKQMPVCDSLYETPPPRPESAPPAPPPEALRPQKVSGTLGAADCDYVLHQDKTGRWQWDQACYCSDVRKPKDAGAPLSNAVRCDAPVKKE